MEKYIFDLDGTIMNMNNKKEVDYLNQKFNKEEASRFIPIRYKLVNEYENIYDRIDYELLSEYLSRKCGINISKEFLIEWLKESINFGDELVDGVIPLFEYLKSNNKKIVLLSNWFRDIQRERLRNQKILKYFDNVYGGELYLKPSRGAFIQAAGTTPFSECVMVGNDYNKDVLPARRIGITGVYYAPNDEIIEDKLKVKRLIDIKEMF